MSAATTVEWVCGGSDRDRLGRSAASAPQASSHTATLARTPGTATRHSQPWSSHGVQSTNPPLSPPFRSLDHSHALTSYLLLHAMLPPPHFL
eukprot:2740870-Rhodomonas_salina.8